MPDIDPKEVEMGRAPLKIDQDDWRSRWLVFTCSGKLLHRVAAMQWEDAEDMVAGDGETLCGRKGWLHMPGIFSRMEQRRCSMCCKLMGIEGGEGNPYNQGIYEPGDAPPDLDRLRSESRG